MTTNQDATVPDAAVEAAEAGMYQRMTWASLHWNALDPDQQRELAAAALTAAAPIIAAQAKGEALKEAADDLDRRAEQFDKISDNPKDHDYETLVRYGAFAAEARTSAYRLHGNADRHEGATP